MSREEADRRAHEEYARFEERRRQEVERAGEAETMKVLEQTARDVEKVKKSQGRRKRGGG